MTTRIELSCDGKHDLLLSNNFIGFIPKNAKPIYQLPSVYTQCTILTDDEKKQIAFTLLFELLAGK